MESPSTLIQHFGATALTDFQFTYSNDVPERLRKIVSINKDFDSRIKPGLLQLPPEVRHMIYHQLGFSTNHRRKVQTSKYKADEISVRASYFFTDGDGRHTQRGVQTPLNPIVKCKGITTNVMRVCRAIASETYELLYGDTNIGIGWDMATERGWYVSKKRPSPPESIELPFPPEPYPTFLGYRALSHVTHITLGPLSHPEYVDALDVYMRMLDYIAFRCRKLEYLGVHLSDKCQIPNEGNRRLHPFIDALANVMRCCQIKKLWIGTARYAHENLNLAVAKQLASTSKYGELDQIRATALRLQSDAQRDVIAADEDLSERHLEFESRRTSLASVIENDYRIKNKKEKVLGKVDDLLRNWRGDVDLSKFDGIPQTVLTAMQLQLSSYHQLLPAQMTLAARIQAFEQLNALVAFISQQQATELDEKAQRSLAAKLRQCVVSPAAKSTAAGKINHRMSRMTALLPESLSFLPSSYDPHLLDTLAPPVNLAADTETIEQTAKRAYQEARRLLFAEIRTRAVSAARQAQESALPHSTATMTAEEARDILAEYIGKTMSNMGFKTAPAPVRADASAASWPKNAPEVLGVGQGR